MKYDSDPMYHHTHASMWFIMKMRRISRFTLALSCGKANTSASRGEFQRNEMVLHQAGKDGVSLRTYRVSVGVRGTGLAGVDHLFDAAHELEQAHESDGV